MPPVQGVRPQPAFPKSGAGPRGTYRTARNYVSGKGAAASPLALSTIYHRWAAPHSPPRRSAGERGGGDDRTAFPLPSSGGLQLPSTPPANPIRDPSPPPLRQPLQAGRAQAVPRGVGREASGSGDPPMADVDSASHRRDRRCRRAIPRRGISCWPGFGAGPFSRAGNFPIAWRQTRAYTLPPINATFRRGEPSWSSPSPRRLRSR